MSFLGTHTVDELKEWLAALDYQVERVEAARAASTWQRSDPAGFAAWAVDWAALRRRYDAAHAFAQGAVDDPVTSFFGSVGAVGNEWEAVARATTQVEGTQTRGDLQELVDRFNVGDGKRITFPDNPQPTAKDFDLAGYQAADTVIRQTPVGTVGRALGLEAGSMPLSTKLLIGGGLALAFVTLVRR
jgi:hypothetical protein